MRRLTALGGLIAVLLLAGAAGAQESIPPITVGGGQTSTKVVEGQVIEVAAVGVTATVNFTEISESRVSGIAIRTSGGSSSGSVTIRWVTRNRQQTISLGPLSPEGPFCMEGGDIDRRTGAELSQP